MASILLKAVVLGCVASAAAEPCGSKSGWASPAGPPSNYSGTPTVTVKNGTIAGLHSTTYNEDIFLGIPYAQPPVGENRFRTAQSVNVTYNHIRKATEFAPACAGHQNNGFPTSEDCLYLNVIRPSGHEHEKLPVAVWIHGGGLTQGGAQSPRTSLYYIVNNSVHIDKPIIGVSIQYRLSGWGFLSSQEVHGAGQTNLGLRDQRLALHWLRENIGAFGGDPDKLTIWGESAGAGSVGWHLTAYNGRDDKIFRAGIMESGNAINYANYRDNSYYQPLYDDLVDRVGCANATDSLDCLRRVPYSTLAPIFNLTSLGSKFSPVVDGDFIQRWGSIQLDQGDFVRVPIIEGANTDEGTAFSPMGVNDTDDFINEVTNPNGNNPISAHFVSQVLEAYPDSCDYLIPTAEEVPCNVSFPPGYGANYRRSAAYFGDAFMIANRRGTCRAWAKHGVDAYCYRFNTIPAGTAWYQGVTHTKEVPFVFGNIHGYGFDTPKKPNPFLNKPRSFIDLSNLMSYSWVSFIHDLNPNNWTGRPCTTKKWPAYSVREPQDMVWDVNVTELAYPESDSWRASGIDFILTHSLAYHR